MNVLALTPGSVIERYMEGEIVLDAWEGSQSRAGSYSSKDTDKPSSGRVKVHVEAVWNAPHWIITEEQLNALRYLKQHDAMIRDSIFCALFDDLPNLRETYADDIPDLLSPHDLFPYIGLGTVHVMDVHKDGFAYLGFELGCTWDEEHGAGVMTYRDRVLELGQVDASFVTHAAEEDGGIVYAQPEPPVKSTPDRMEIGKSKTELTAIEKPWWKFGG